MKTPITLTMIGLLSLSGVAAMAASDMMNQTDRDFVKAAMEANTAEVQEAKMTQSMGHDPALNMFTHHMISDHTQAKEDLEKIVKSMGMTPSSMLNSNDKMEMARLNKLREPEFSSEYIASQKKAHQQAIALFEKEKMEGKNPQLKEYAATYLPKLKEHEAEVSKLKPETMKKS